MKRRPTLLQNEDQELKLRPTLLQKKVGTMKLRPTFLQTKTRNNEVTGERLLEGY